MLEQLGDSLKRKTKSKAGNVEKKRHKDEEMARKEKLKEERKLKREVSNASKLLYYGVNFHVDFLCKLYLR